MRKQVNAPCFIVARTPSDFVLLVTALSSSATTASSTALSSRRSSFEDRAPARLTRFTPPENFGTVVDGKIFRSSYPKEENYSYLQALKLKSIL